MLKKFAIGTECSPKIADFYDSKIPFKVVDVAVGDDAKSTLLKWIEHKNKDRAVTWIAINNPAMVTTHQARVDSRPKN